MSSAQRVRYHSSLDTALPVRAVEGVVRLKGWCFAAGGDARPLVQLRIGRLVLAAAAAARRDDVAAAYPAQPQALNSGFEISGHVPAGLSVAELWAGRDGFGWELLLSFSVLADPAVLHGAIDLPADKLVTTNRTLDGWCFHPQREIVELWLHYGTRSVRCRHYGHERADVGNQFPHLPQARFSGFSSEDILKPGEGRVRLRAVDREGGVYFCETDREIRLQPAAAVAPAGDPRLDGRALFRAFSGQQSQLPALRLLVPAGHRGAAADLQRIADAMAALPGGNWLLVALTGQTPVSPELRNLAAANPHLRLGADAAPSAACRDLHLLPGDTPDIHGLMAALLAAAEHPGLAAIYGDFTTGDRRVIQRQPAWSPDLALAGGIHPFAPVLLASGATGATEPSPFPRLATSRAAVAHVSASLLHRPEATAAEPADYLALLKRARPGAQLSKAAGPGRIRYEPAASFRRPRVTAIVPGGAAALAPLREAFAGEVDEWLAAGDRALNEVVKSATGELLCFLPPGARPATDQPVTRLALHLAGAPAAAALPLLLRANFAPWTEADIFSDRTRRTLGAFDPAFAPWTDRTLALFTRQVPYLTLPGLLIARSRWQELGGFDANYESGAGALLDLSFRLRTAGTPPLLCAEARLIAPPSPQVLSSFEETLLLDRWDRNEDNPLRIHPLVPVEVLA